MSSPIPSVPYEEQNFDAPEPDIDEEPIEEEVQKEDEKEKLDEASLDNFNQLHD